MSVLLSTAYFPNIYYFTKIIQEKNILIENDETFPKQTYRNRCKILSPNGVLPLILPVKKGRSGKLKTKDIKISYADNWQHNHFQSIKTAYSSAPFYEFFIDDISVFFKKKYKFLIDLNTDILLSLIDILEIHKNIKFTEKFVKIDNSNPKDFRFYNNPKIRQKDDNFKSKSYIQVFSDRMKFKENLTVLDLIFNLGQESLSYLKSCIK